MSVVADVVARLRADSSNMVAGFNSASRASVRMQAEANRSAGLWKDSAGKWRNAAGQYASSAQMAASGIEHTSREVEHLDQKTRGLTRTSVGMGGAMRAVPWAVAAGGIALVGGAALKGASDMEQNKVAFTTMLGSAKKADKMLADMRAFAAATPFELPSLLQGTKRLLSFGFAARDIKPMLTSVGDAASGLGLGQDGIERLTMALGQMKSKGKASGEELLQMAEAGVPAIQYLADSYNTTTGKVQAMVTKGLVPADRAINAITHGMEKGSKHAKGFGGMMAAQSKTMAGVWSTLKDTVNNALTDAMMPVLPTISKTITAITPLVGGFVKGVSGGIGKVGSLVKGAVSPMVGPMKKGFAEMSAGAKKFASSGGEGGKTLKALGAFARGMLPTLQQLGQKFMNMLGPALKQIGAVINNEFLPAFRKFLPVAQPIVNFFLKVFGSAVIGAVQGVLKVVQGAFQILAGIFNVFTALAHGDWSELWKGIKQIVSGAVNVVKGVIQFLWNAGIINVFRKGAQFLLKGLWVKLWAGLKGGAIKGVAWIIQGVKTLVTSFPAVFRMALNLAVSAFRGGFSGLLAAAKALPGMILKGVGKLGTLLLSAGKNVVRGLWNGIKSMGGWLKDTLTGWVKDIIPGPIAGALGIHSPSRVAAALGRFVPLGLAQGIHQTGGKAAAASRDLAGRVTTTLTKNLRKTTAAATKGGKDTGEALAKGLKKAKERAARLAAIVDVAHQIDKGFTDAVRSVIKGADNVSVAFRAKWKDIRSAVSDGIDGVLSKFHDKMQKVLDFQRSIRDQMKEFGSLFSFDTSADGPITLDGLLGNMQEKLAQIKAFGAALDALRKKHLSNDILQQIIAQGPEIGGQVAQAVLNGGRAGIDALNHANHQLGVAASAVGDVGSLSQYGLTGAQAQGGVQTSVTVQNGAIRFHFGDGVSAKDRRELTAMVHAAVTKALGELAREIRRKKK